MSVQERGVYSGYRYKMKIVLESTEKYKEKVSLLYPKREATTLKILWIRVYYSKQ